MPDPFDIEHLVRHSSGRVLASLIRTLGDLDAAEDALADALALAAERWPTDGAPDSPEAWLLTVARRKAIDRIRRERHRDDRHRSAALLTEPDHATAAELADERWRSGVDDDLLRLIFTCCHPALALDARVALTLRTVAGLTTPEIARAFLVPEATLAQRLVRAKRKIRVANIPYRVPSGHELPDRLDAVLGVVLLVFNEGYLASSGDDPLRLDLATRALDLAALLVDLMPDEPECAGLLALLRLQHARRDARVDAAGDLVTLEHQDRSRWRHDEIAAARSLLDTALARRSPGPLQIQAAIAALHDMAPAFGDTDWPQIAALYAELHRRTPTPVVALNHAVAVSFADGPAAALPLVERLLAEGTLDRHHLLHATHADLLTRLGRTDDARVATRRAVDLAPSSAERRLLERRLAALDERSA